jgi:hypothetical protein
MPYFSCVALLLCFTYFQTSPRRGSCHRLRPSGDPLRFPPTHVQPSLASISTAVHGMHIGSRMPHAPHGVVVPTALTDDVFKATEGLFQSSISIYAFWFIYSLSHVVVRVLMCSDRRAIPRRLPEGAEVEKRSHSLRHHRGSPS